MKSGKKISDKISLQRLIVSLCICAVCIGTQQIQTVKWDTGIIEFSRDSLGVVMALILFTHYKWNDFVKYKIPYIIWSVLGVILGVIIIPFAIGHRLNFLVADTLIIALGIFLMGYCVIHTFISFFVEKYRPKFYLPLFIIWIVMLLLMIFSRSDYLWPECYFTLFLCYYMTPQTTVQRTDVTMGLINGMILGLVVIQSHALLCRPYDRVRYNGNFCNPNNNSLFLCLCLAAILAKILFVTKADKRKIVRIFYFVLAGACYSLICMTISRTGYLSAFVATFFFLIAYCRVKGKKIFIRTGMLLVSLFIIMLPLTYLAVRYIPTIHPHVLFYFQEGYDTSRVHSWDERNSEKYVTFEQMLREVFGRFGAIKNAMDDLQSTGNSGIETDALKIASCADRFPLVVLENTIDPNKIPILSKEDIKNSLLVRKTIYKWYFEHLSLRGIPYDEQGFQLTEEQWIQHAHSIYLDYGINFGYPVMILFTVFIWWGIGRLVLLGMRAGDIEKLSCLLIALIPPVFGLFEFSWGTGLISTVAFYFVFREMFVCTEHGQSAPLRSGLHQSAESRS